MNMADAKGVMSRTGSKGFRALKTLTDGVITKFNMAALAVAAVFLVLGNTEPAKTEDPTTITPGETVEVTPAQVVFDKPRIEDGQVHVTATITASAGIVAAHHQAFECFFDALSCCVML